MTGDDGDDKKAKASRRRGLKIGGEEVDAAATPRRQQRDLDEIMELGRSEAEEVPATFTTKEGTTTYPYAPDMLEAFLAGRITLGDLEGITKEEQYKIAEVGFSYLAAARLDEAKVVFDGLLALDPFDAYFHTALASIAQQRNDYETADRHYSRALEINPFSATAYANRGEVRIQMGRLPDGAADLARAVAEDPDAVEPATLRARATINVLKEQLGALDLDDLQQKAAASTDSRVEAAREAPDLASRPEPTPEPSAPPPVPSSQVKRKVPPRPKPRGAARRPSAKKPR